MLPLQRRPIFGTFGTMKWGSETTPPPHEYPCVYVAFLWIAINTTSMQYITYNSPVPFMYKYCLSIYTLYSLNQN